MLKKKRLNLTKGLTLRNGNVTRQEQQKQQRKDTTTTDETNINKTIKIFRSR